MIASNRTRPTWWLLAVLLSVPRTSSGQDLPPTTSPPLEALAETATRAVVLSDVQTASGSRQGSGFLVDAGGLILTNFHVARDARSARVTLASGDVYDRVSILVQDARRDIPVLQVAGFALPTLILGNSDSVRIGASVVLIGSPLGLENTVSTGIVSGRRQEPEGFQLIQITAPASPGSSGGAVLSASGQVIGIVASHQVAGQNLNFAGPINYARGLLYAYVGYPSGNSVNAQNVRAGSPGVTVTATSSNVSAAQVRTPPASGASVTAVIVPGLYYTPLSFATGGFVLDPVAAGQTTVAVSASGFISQPIATQLVTITP